MKLLVDACVAASAKIALAQAGHEAESVADWDQDPGDLAILAHAAEHQQSVVTLDKISASWPSSEPSPIEAFSDRSISVALITARWRSQRSTRTAPRARRARSSPSSLDASGSARPNRTPTERRPVMRLRSVGGVHVLDGRSYFGGSTLIVAEGPTPAI